MSTSFTPLAMTLLAGAVTFAASACSKDLPTHPEEKPGAGGVGSDALPAVVAANDDFDAATVVGSLPFSDAVNTSEATTAVDDPATCFGTGPTVWYRFTPSADIRISANTFDSDYDTGLSAYTGVRGDLVEVACNDDAGATLQSRVTIDAVAGQTIFFMVGAFASGPGGNLVFNVDVAPPALEAGATIDGFGTVNASTGSAIVRGTVTCSRPATAFLEGILRDRIGRIRVEAPFFIVAECDGASSWTVEAVPQNALLTGGPVEVEIFGFIEDPLTGELVLVQETATVHLRGRS
jgi:hypothetical protein